MSGTAAVLGGASSAGESAQGGAAGSAADSSGGVGGAGVVENGGNGGGAGEPACRSDGDCGDGLACNGEERCALGSCQAGTSVSCSDELTCREREGEAACEFASAGPWVTFYGATSVHFFSLGLYGVPAHYANRLPPIELTRAAIDGDNQALIDYRWSADGRYLMLNVAGEQRALYGMEFGNGLPSAARLIPNLPRDEGQYSIASFDPSVACTVAQERGMLFKICFGSSGVVADLIHSNATPDLDLSGARYCAGASAVLASSRLFDLEASEQEPELLPGFQVSPDGKHLLGLDSAGLSLRPCALGSDRTVVALPVAVDDGYLRWAPDSRHALVHVEWPTDELLLVDVPSAGDVERWRGTLADPDDYALTFSGDSKYALLRDGSTFSLITVADGTQTSLPLPGGAVSVEWADDGVTLLIQRALEPGLHTAGWWLLEPLGAARSIFESDVEGVSVTTSLRAGLALVIAGTKEPILSIIDLKDVAAGPRNLQISGATGPFQYARIAVDGSGVALIHPEPTLDDLYWVSLLAGNEGKMTKLNQGNSVFGEFQPWP